MQTPVAANTFAIDNILLTPVGPDITIADPEAPAGWITATCFKGGDPVVLTGNIRSGYFNFSTPDFIVSAFNNPAFQWRKASMMDIHEQIFPAKQILIFPILFQLRTLFL